MSTKKLFRLEDNVGRRRRRRQSLFVIFKKVRSREANFLITQPFHSWVVGSNPNK